MIRLELYLRGHLFQSTEIPMLEYESELNFQQNTEMRKHEIMREVNQLKAMYYNQICKCNFDFEIIAFIPSKLNLELV